MVPFFVKVKINFEATNTPFHRYKIELLEQMQFYHVFKLWAWSDNQDFTRNFIPFLDASFL